MAIASVHRESETSIPLYANIRFVVNVFPDRVAHPTEWRTSQHTLERRPILNPKNAFLYKN